VHARAIIPWKVSGAQADNLPRTINMRHLAVDVEAALENKGKPVAGKVGAAHSYLIITLEEEEKRGDEMRTGTNKTFAGPQLHFIATISLSTLT